MNAAVGALLFAIALLGAIACRAEVGEPDRGLSPPFRNVHAIREKGYTLAQATPDSEWVKQVLRLQYTEFCATVKPPPKSLVEAVQTAAQAGNTDAQVAFMWLARILERYQTNGCGDA